MRDEEVLPNRRQMGRDDEDSRHGGWESQQPALKPSVRAQSALYRIHVQKFPFRVVRKKEPIASDGGERAPLTPRCNIGNEEHEQEHW